MDSLQSQQLNLNSLSDTDKRELQQFILNESQLASRRHQIHGLTDKCWKKCITGGISSGKLERKEEGCVQNCVERFVDSTQLVLKYLDEMRAAGAV